MANCPSNILKYSTTFWHNVGWISGPSSNQGCRLEVVIVSLLEAVSMHVLDLKILHSLYVMHQFHWQQNSPLAWCGFTIYGALCFQSIALWPDVSNLCLDQQEDTWLGSCKFNLNVKTFLPWSSLFEPIKRSRFIRGETLRSDGWSLETVERSDKTGKPNKEQKWFGVDKAS